MPTFDITKAIDLRHTDFGPMNRERFYEAVKPYPEETMFLMNTEQFDEYYRMLTPEEIRAAGMLLKSREDGHRIHGGSENSKRLIVEVI